MILAGAEDISARRAEAKALYDRVRTHGDLQVFPAAGHLQMMQTDPDRYRRAVLDFVRKIRDLKRGSP